MTLRSPLASVRDHRTLFTEDELRGAYSLVIDDELAASRAAETYREPEPGHDCWFVGDTFTLLSLVSDDLAKRIQALLDETDEQVALRIADRRDAVAHHVCAHRDRDECDSSPARLAALRSE